MSDLTTAPVTVPAVSADLHASVQQFYAHHMQMLDDGRVESWAQGFTEDGVFAADGHPHPATGREQIVAGASRTVAQLAEQGISRRHWLGMIAITPGDGVVRARSYAIVYQITAADGASIRSSTTCEDVLVPDGRGSWLIRHRYVRQDVPA